MLQPIAPLARSDSPSNVEPSSSKSEPNMRATASSANQVASSIPVSTTASSAVQELRVANNQSQVIPPTNEELACEEVVAWAREKSLRLSKLAMGISTTTENNPEKLEQLKRECNLQDNATIREIIRALREQYVPNDDDGVNRLPDPKMFRLKNAGPKQEVIVKAIAISKNNFPGLQGLSSSGWANPELAETYKSKLKAIAEEINETAKKLQTEIIPMFVRSADSHNSSSSSSTLTTSTATTTSAQPAAEPSSSVLTTPAAVEPAITPVPFQPFHFSDYSMKEINRSISSLEEMHAVVKELENRLNKHDVIQISCDNNPEGMQFIQELQKIGDITDPSPTNVFFLKPKLADTVQGPDKITRRYTNGVIEEVTGNKNNAVEMWRGRRIFPNNGPIETGIFNRFKLLQGTYTSNDGTTTYLLPRIALSGFDRYLIYVDFEGERRQVIPARKKPDSYFMSNLYIQADESIFQTLLSILRKPYLYEKSELDKVLSESIDCKEFVDFLFSKNEIFNLRPHILKMLLEIIQERGVSVNLHQPHSKTHETLLSRYSRNEEVCTLIRAIHPIPPSPSNSSAPTPPPSARKDANSSPATNPSHTTSHTSSSVTAPSMTSPPPAPTTTITALHPSSPRTTPHVTSQRSSKRPSKVLRRPAPPAPRISITNTAPHPSSPRTTPLVISRRSSSPAPAPSMTSPPPAPPAPPITITNTALQSSSTTTSHVTTSRRSSSRASVPSKTSHTPAPPVAPPTRRWDDIKKNCYDIHGCKDVTALKVFVWTLTVLSCGLLYVFLWTGSHAMDYFCPRHVISL